MTGLVTSHNKRLEQDGEKNKIQQKEDGPNERSELVGRTQVWHQGYFKGWRSGVLLGAISAVTIFLINLITTVWAIAHAGNGLSGTLALYSGSCTRVHKLNTGIHLLLNIFSTILLSGSNYCMQCLSAPTRQEVDKAHAKNRWLDIGVFSIRNLKSISKKRVILWCCLCISSLPLHLFYNAAVFSSISVNGYYIFYVGENFLQTNNATFESDPSSPTRFASEVFLANQMLGENTSIQVTKLDNAACIDAYAEPLQSARGNVMVVLDGQASNEILDDQYAEIPKPDDSNQESYDSERIPQHGQYLNFKQTTRNQTGPPVKYCLSESVPQFCDLQISLGLAVFVTCANLFKAVIMFFIVFGIKERPLMTIGDAISSFMEQPDHFTDNMCLLSKWKADQNSKQWSIEPRFYVAKRRFWFNSSSLRRWILSLFIYFISLTICGILYSKAFEASDVSSNIKNIWNLGFGVANGIFFINWRSGLDGSWIGNTIMANIPQPTFSFLYYTYNGLFTTMLLADEWSHFAHQRKGLRVRDTPRGSQRSTYFLSLPYRFALPLLAVSGLLHWLVSQSLFFVSVKAYDYDQNPNSTATPTRIRQHKQDFVTTGYSPIAILTVIIVGALVVFIAIATSLRRFKSGIPMAGSCSAAISAACHPNSIEDEHASTLPLQWGVTAINDGVGHCTFSSKEVDRLDEYTRYAGFDSDVSLCRRSRY